MARASLVPMRILRSVILPCSFLALAAAAACTQAPSGEGSLVGAPPGSEPGDDTSSKIPAPSEGKESPSSTGSSGPVNATCIGQAGFTFDDAGECDVCMSDQDGCCQKLVACFKDDPQCAALQKCVDDCSGTGGGGDGGGGGAGPGQAIFVAEVNPSLNPTCGSCHQLGTGGAPIFFGADALATYTQFKARGFHTNSTLLNKGPHAGPALTAAQVALVQKWRTAEGGGGGGGADAGGDGGALTGKACKDACKTTHAASLEKWNAYQTCITTTCKTQCE